MNAWLAFGLGYLVGTLVTLGAMWFSRGHTEPRPPR